MMRCWWQGHQSANTPVPAIPKHLTCDLKIIRLVLDTDWTPRQRICSPLLQLKVFKRGAGAGG